MCNYRWRECCVIPSRSLVQRCGDHNNPHPMVHSLFQCGRVSSDPMIERLPVQRRIQSEANTMTKFELRNKIRSLRKEIESLCYRDSTDTPDADGKKLDGLMKQLSDLMSKLDAMTAADEAVDEVDTEDRSWKDRSPMAMRAAMRASGQSTRVSRHTIGGDHHDQFSVVKALRSISENRPLEGVEADQSARCAEGRTLRANSFVLPFGRDQNYETRAGELTSGTGSGMVTTIFGDDFLYILRKASILDSLQIQTILAPAGRFRLPRETSNAQANWTIEGVDCGVSPMAADYIEVSPMNLIAEVIISRNLLYSSGYDVESIVRTDLANAIGEKLSNTILNGTGVNPEPQGLFNLSTVGVVPLGAPSTYSWTDALAVEAAILAGNPPAGAVIKSITSPLGQQILKSTTRVSGSTPYPSCVSEDNKINGYDCIASNHVSSSLSYCVCSQNLH
jgi:HK97 family phage major capsid protein